MIPLAKKAIGIQGPDIESKRFKTVPFEANNSGVTLAEILVAIIVLLIKFLGHSFRLQGSLIRIRSLNQIRY
jgi:hypothetical protein